MFFMDSCVLPLLLFVVVRPTLGVLSVWAEGEALAVLRHQWVRRDGALRRML